jgi:hypothetical protein
VSDHRHHHRLLHREHHHLDGGDHRGVHQENRFLRRALLMQRAVAAGTEFQSRLGEDAEHRERPGADAGDRPATAHSKIRPGSTVVTVELPREAWPAAPRDAALLGATQREQERRQLSALLFQAEPRLTAQVILARRRLRPEAEQLCDDVREQALRGR